jgi:double-stranded RNA-binding protein Staufen
MPPRLQTSFKQAKKTAAKPPQPITSMKPLQGGKSAVSTVHDLAYQNGWTVNWFEESETGPAHAKVFSMKVTMGPYEVSGSGRSKKLAKQDAAQLLAAQVSGNEVADIMGLPGFTGNAGQTSQAGNTSEDYGPQLPQAAGQKTISVGPSGGDNPISMLDHVVKKHKLGEPQYITECENGPLALQRFDMKVKVNNMEASGLGRSKKVAKRNAAQAMLDQLSRTQTGIQPPKKRIMFVKASSETATNTATAINEG